MRFHHMQALKAAYPHIELHVGDAFFDVHNAGDLQRIHMDFQARCFEIHWRVENLLGIPSHGAWRIADVVLRVTGVTAWSASGEIAVGSADGVGFDFIELIPDHGPAGTLCFVFEPTGEIRVSGTDCELRYTVVEAPG